MTRRWSQRGRRGGPGLFVLAAVAGVLGCHAGWAAGTWTFAPWTGDADSGITRSCPYTVAVNSGGTNVTVNGVEFQTNASSGANFLIEGAPSTSGSGANVTGDSATLANDFIYGGNPCIVTLTNLTPGATYETTFFSYGWDAAGTTRIQTFATGSDSLVLDQDLYGRANGIRIAHRFVADAASKVFTITPSGDGTFHLSALANREVTPATILGFGTNVIGSRADLGRPVGGVAAIAWTVPHSTGLSTVAPTFTLSSGSCDPASGTVRDFSAGPVTYTVTDGGVTNVYAVTAAKAPPRTACDIVSYHANLAGSRATVMPSGPRSGSVVVNVPSGTADPPLAALKPALTLSPGATCVIPAPPLNRTAPVRYIVTAEDGVTTKDYTATVVTNGEAFGLFVVKTTTNGLTSADYDYLAAVPASRHRNNGVPAVFAVASTNDFTSNIYLQDYLRRYRPTAIHTLNFSATIPNFASSAIRTAGPVELSVYLATNFWTSSGKVVLVSDAVDAANYPNVLQASALAAVLDAPLIYYNSKSAKQALVKNAIQRLGATEVIHVDAAGTQPAMATLVLTGPAAIVKYLAGKGIMVDYFAVTNPKDLNLVSGAKLSLVAPFVAARRNGIVVPIARYACNTNELFHYTGYPAIKAELQQLYQTIGRYPGYLALVGNATSLPLCYRTKNEQAGQYSGSPADLDYSDVDADPFPDIAIGRIMAYHVFDATLLACRISTYEQLFDGVWEKTMVDVGGQWDSAYQNALGANYGFRSASLVGKLGPTQPVEAAIIGHNDHSTYHTVGGAFDVNSANVLAPAFIGSDGCASAAIDFETVNESYDEATGWKNSDRGSGVLVVNHLFKLGAVAYVGSTRSETGPGKMRQSAAMNALLAGEPLGRCYMAGVDTMSWNGPADERWNWILLGDPGLRIHVPSAPVVAPASHTVTPASSNTAILTVTIPSTLFTAEVDPTWCSHWGLTYPQYWGEKAGLYGMDVDRFYLVRFTPPRPVLNVEELETWTNVNTWVWGNVKLGMMGPPAKDDRQDGSHQLVWAIRAHIMDWPRSGSKVPLAQMTQATFRITYDLVPDITAFNANLAGSSARIQSVSDTHGLVVVHVPTDTTDAQIATLAPTYTLDFGATCNQPNGAVPTPPLSATRPVSYLVSPEAGSRQPPKVFDVTVVRSPFTCAPWTDDSDSGITQSSPYTVAVNFGGTHVTVNGVAFQASALSGPGFSIDGGLSTFNGAIPNITGDSLALASDFIYDGNPRTVTLKNLTPGKTYETTFFSYGFEDSGRTAAFASGDDSRGVDQDAYGNGNGIRIMYRFVAGPSGTQVITITPAAGSLGTFHLCALANRRVSDPRRPGARPAGGGSRGAGKGKPSGK